MRRIQTAILFSALAIFVLALVLSGSSYPGDASQTVSSNTQSNGITFNALNYQVVRVDDLPQEVVKKIERFKQNPFSFSVPITGKESQYVVIGLGQRPTGGYSIAIKSVEDVEGMVSTVFTEVQPGKDAMVTQALSFPWIAIEVDSTLPVTVVKAD